MASSKEGEHGLKFDISGWIKKQRNNKGRRKLCDNQRKRIYLVYDVFKAWRMQKSRRDVTVGIAVISPHICCLLNTEEGKNNAIYVL